MIHTMHLFAGGGGGILADLILGHIPVCAVEINRYCRKMLRRRQRDKILPPFPIYKDVRKFNGTSWKDKVDIISAGFPCQPFSTAGSQKGEQDERNLWPSTIKIIREVGCPIAFLENVPGLLSFDYFGQILGDLAEAGFNAEWDVVSAASVGAPHIRERLWILAYSNQQRFQTAQDTPQSRKGGVSVCGPNRQVEEAIKRRQKCEFGSGSIGDAPNPECHGRNRFQDNERSATLETKKRGMEKEGSQSSIASKDCHADASHPNSKRQQGYRGWDSESGIRRISDGIPHGMDRIKALGNAQVPQVAAKAFLMLAKRAGILKGEVKCSY